MWLKKGGIVVISEVKKRPFWVAISVFKKGSLGWCLVWLPTGSFE